jgi:starch-binding outer membrane protein, SusD/RagB family
MKKTINISIAAIIITLAMVSCLKDLDTKPLDKSVATLDDLFSSDSSEKVVDQMFAKCYATIGLSGQGSEGWRLPDIENPDQGVATFFRGYWNAEELPTDEAMNVWSDADLNEYHYQSWSSNNSYIRVIYQRIFFNISVCNEFIRNISPKVDGATPELKTKWGTYIAEVRFLRAYYYYCAMDLWGNVPFATDQDLVGAFMPPRIKSADLFAYIESELKAIDPILLPANRDPNYYARANKAAAWSLLAKMYLNAETYCAQNKYSECITYCDSIINSGYTLHPVYAELFLADNDVTCQDEIIFCIAQDGRFSKNYGGTTYLVNAEVGGDMTLADFGIASGWGGNLTTTTFIGKFSDPSGATDTRALFYSHGDSVKPLAALSTFASNLALSKFKNITSTGTPGSNGTFVDIDFPLFRLADIYLTYAEAVLRGGTGGSRATALGYINALRERAYGNTSGNIADAALTLPFILDERGRELYWECQRRTDLIRFGLLTSGNYLWDWKGGEANGTGTENFLVLYPLPVSDMNVNSNLVQNPGY